MEQPIEEEHDEFFRGVPSKFMEVVYRYNMVDVLNRMEDHGRIYYGRVPDNKESNIVLEVEDYAAYYATAGIPTLTTSSPNIEIIHVPSPHLNVERRKKQLQLYLKSKFRGDSRNLYYWQSKFRDKHRPEAFYEIFERVINDIAVIICTHSYFSYR